MNTKRFEVTISTDGACSGNPGPGAIAYVMRYGDKVKEDSEYIPMTTTNSRMELLAVVTAVRALKKPCDITVRTDSQFVCNGIANMKELSKNGWKTKTGAMYAHFDLWQGLYNEEVQKGHYFHFQYVPGHSGDPDNERANYLAQQEIKVNKRIRP